MAKFLWLRTLSCKRAVMLFRWTWRQSIWDYSTHFWQSAPSHIREYFSQPLLTHIRVMIFPDSQNISFGCIISYSRSNELIYPSPKSLFLSLLSSLFINAETLSRIELIVVSPSLILFIFATNFSDSCFSKALKKIFLHINYFMGDIFHGLAVVRDYLWQNIWLFLIILDNFLIKVPSLLSSHSLWISFLIYFLYTFFLA